MPTATPAPAQSTAKILGPTALVPRWMAHIHNLCKPETDRHRFYWTLIVRVSMEEILKPMHHAIFSGHVGNGPEADLVNLAMWRIRTDATKLTPAQKAAAMKELVQVLINTERLL